MRHWWTKSMCGRGQPATRSWGRWIGTSSRGKESVSAFRYSSSSEGFDKESSSSSGSDDNASESESEDESDIQSQSAHGGRKRVLHKHSAQMPRKKSPAEVDLNNGKVTAHGLEWKFVDDVSVDAYKDIRYKPKLRVADTASIPEISDRCFFVARALVKSFRKQTQGSNLARNALQRQSCTRQLGFFMLWHLMCAGNAGIIGPLLALLTFIQHQHSVFVSEWSEITLSKYRQLFPSLFVQLMTAPTRGFQQGHSSTYICAPAQHPLHVAPSYVYCL